MAHELLVFFFEPLQGILVGPVYFLPGPGLAEHFGKTASQVDAEVTDHIVGHAGKLQDALINKLQKADISKIVLVQEVENDDIRLLPLAVAAVDALFDGQRDVRQIIVDDEGTEFQVESFRTDVRRNEDTGFFLETLHHGIVAGAAAVVCQHLALVGTAVQQRKKKILRGTVFGKNQCLLLRAEFLESGETLLQAAKQFFGLGVLLNVGSQSLHLPEFGQLGGNLAVFGPIE